MDDSIAVKTQEALSSLVKKTPLTLKLLSKPPFRFLHDVISEVIRNSGFGNGLYSGAETDSAAIKDKEAKIAYLNKIIDHVGTTLGVEIKARPQKIVAGLEPEETNTFLQLLGKAAKKKPGDSQTPPSSPKKAATAQEKTSSSEALSGKRSASKSRLADDKSKRDSTKHSASKSRESIDSVRKPASNPSPVPTPADVERKGSAEHVPRQEPNRSESAAIDGSEPTRKERKSEKIVSAEPELEIEERQVPNVEPRKVEDDVVVVARNELEEERTRNRRRVEDIVEEKHDIAESIPGPEEIHHLVRPMSVRRPMRPASARPAPPRQKVVEVVPEMPSQPVNIIEEKSKPGADDDEDYIVVAPTATPALTALPQPIGGAEGSMEQHGGLVRKMLETKKELESDTGTSAPSGGTTEEDANGSNMFTTRERMTARKEIEALRESIQTLCRCTNPLGTTMDYVQEDVDSMNKELEYWVKEYKQYSSKHDEALRLTKESLEPLENQLKQLEISIEEKYDLISSCKAKILENENTIQKLLSSIAQPIR